MKKAFGQTVRELKREVNKKILNVPGIEQKVLDATSNEPWGPHGSLLADIAMSTRSSQEYQTVMAVIWKRINDTGKNWRHVYKALTILDYLVAHGSERVIDEIREHAHQISTLSDFRYTDSCGRDQGNNVRKKSQNLVALVNDKERIIEVRQKAIANKERFRNRSTGGIHRSVSGGYDGRYDYDRYGSKNGDQYGYGRDRDRDREFFYKDDGRYGRYGDSKRKDGDRYGRDYEDRYSLDVYRDDEYRGRNASIDDYKYDRRSRSCNINHAFDEDDALSRGARANYHSPDGRPLERKFSEQNIGAPPSYEEAVSETQSPVHGERDGETSVSTAPKVSPPTSNNPNQTACDFGNSASPPNQQVEAFDAFDPRSSFSATPTTTTVAPAPPNVVQTASTNAKVDLIEALSDALAIVPTTAETVVAETDALANHPTSNVENQHFDDPFGDGPFKAFPSPDVSPAQQQSLTSVPTMNQNANTCSAPNVSGIQHPSTNCHFLPQEMSTPTQESDILADILGPSGYADVSSHATSFSAPVSQSASHIGTYGNLAQPSFYTQSGANMYSKPTQPRPNPYGQPTQPSANPYGQPRQASSNAYEQTVQPSVNPYCQPAHLGANPYGQPAHPNDNPYAQSLQLGSKNTYVNFNSHTAPLATQIPGSVVQSSYGSCISQNQFNAKNSISALGSVVPFASLSSHQTTNVGATFSPGSNTSTAPVSHPSKDKFEPKSAVWADTFSRGLVNLNISGSKTNPLADIGVDFDAINRKENRMEKHAPATVTSTLTMGKAMGSGSGIGCVGASILRPPVNPMVGFGMGMGLGMGMGVTMGMGGGPAGGMGMGNQQPMGMNPGMGMNNIALNPGMGMNNIALNPSMGINIGMRQGAPHMPPQTGMPGNYNPMMGSGGYSQKPYSGSYQ